MTLKSLLSSLTVAFLVMTVGTTGAQPPTKELEETLKKDFPQIKYEKINPTPIKGIYEILLSNDILYYAPETQNIISGNIFTKDGRNLTQEKRTELEKRNLEIIRGKQGEIPLDKGIKMGAGKHKIIEFSNPDCAFCRKTSKYLGERTDITRYVFFLPFSAQTESKVKYILCADDKAKAYEEAMTGKLDNQTLALCNRKDVDELLKNHVEIARRLGIEATPFFFIDGQVVQGADMTAIEKLLSVKLPE